MVQQQRNQQLTLEDTAAREEHYWKKNFIITGVIVAVLLIYSILHGSGLTIVPSEDRLQITDPDGATVTIAYEDIKGAALMDTPDYGACVSGEETSKWVYGQWNNAAWGDYSLYVYAKNPQVVQIETTQGVYVVNMPTEQDTVTLYDFICDLNG